MAEVQINDAFVKKFKELPDFKNINESVEEAVRFYLKLQEQKKVKDYRGKLTWSGNLDESRESRFGSH